MSKQVVTIGLGNNVDVKSVKESIKYLQKRDYLVYAPFYIAGKLGTVGQQAALVYLKASIDQSDMLYIIDTEKTESDLLSELRAYAIAKNKQVIERG